MTGGAPINESLCERTVSGTLATVLRWTGFLAILAPALLRVLTPISPLPGWEIDPMVIPAPAVGLGPGAMLALDTLVLVGLVAVLLSVWLSGERLHWVLVLLWAIGSIGIVAHGWVIGGGNFDARWNGGAWLSALGGAVGLVHACRDERLRRLGAALLIGSVVVLVARGAQQILIEHPATIANFEANRERFFQAQGWSVDSPMARTYERRLRQPEASGWFGLANVFATFVVVGCVASVGLVLAGWGTTRRRPGAPHSPAESLSLACLAVGALAGAAGLVMAGSKGGYGAAVLGLAGLGAAAVLWSRRSDRLSALLGPGAAALALLAVAARGLVGERIGELSLLFRWFYFRAAGEIGAESPLIGVGPAGFQEAYLLAKSPLSPEEVSSPHNILLEWWATLGLTGVAWAVLWLALASRAASRRDAVSAAAPPPGSLRTEMRALGLVTALLTLAPIWLETPVMTGSLAAVRIGGLGLWLVVGWAVLVVARSSARAMALGLAGACIAEAAHLQIEVSGTWPQSCGLVLALFGIGAAGVLTPETPRLQLDRLAAGASVLVALGLAVLVGGWGAVPAARWEADLRGAAASVRPGTEWMQRTQDAEQIADPSARQAALDEIASELSIALGRPVPASAPSVRGAVLLARRIGAEQAFEGLNGAASATPSSWRTRRVASQVALALAADASASGRRADVDEWTARAVQVAAGGEADSALADAGLRLASELNWIGTTLSTRARLLDLAEDRRLAARFFEAAAEKDPYGLFSALRAHETWREVGDLARARHWAARTLEIDEGLRLDAEAKGLTVQERSSIEAWLAGSAEGP